MKRSAAGVLAVVAWLAPLAGARQVAAPLPIEPPAHVAEHVEPIGAAGAAGAAPAGSDLLSNTLREMSQPLRILLLLSFLTLLPSALLTLTSYTRIIIVLSFVRRAIGAPELPPNGVLIGLALFLTGAVMSPTIARLNDDAIQPWLDRSISDGEAADRLAAGVKSFMLKQTRNDDLLLALDLAGAKRPDDPLATPLQVALPAFALSELRTAFRMGFIVFLPFLLIDLVVASVLLALGMFMLPPTMIAMPLKILLFVLVDGWGLVIQSLALSYAA